MEYLSCFDPRNDLLKFVRLPMKHPVYHALEVCCIAKAGSTRQLNILANNQLTKKEFVIYPTIKNKNKN